MIGRFKQAVRQGRLLLVVLALVFITPVMGVAAPYAALVMDARTGEVLHARNADTRLHPASLTKMMTLYIVFQAIERGEISLDTEITITSDAANEPPSKLGLRTGQKIRLRYLIRAAAVKSANDAATAIGVALSGSVSGFADRMNRTAAAMGMTSTTFRNAHGLTASGHLSTARDMSNLGRHLIYDFPQYYNIFSRRNADAGIAQVNNTNRRFLDAYSGADGIKTGFTNAAGFNLVASAQRGNVRVIATVFGGTSTANRNARVAELLDLGFSSAPNNARVRAPQMAAIAPADVESAPASVPAASGGTPGGSGKTIRVSGQVQTSMRPKSRPAPVIASDALIADAGVIDDAVASAVALAAAADMVTQTEAPVADALATALAEAPIEAAPAAAGEAADPAAITLAQVDAEDSQNADNQDAEAGEVEIALAPATASVTPRARPTAVVMAAANLTPVAPTAPAVVTPAQPEIVTRISTSGGRTWGINVGRYPSRYEAERILLKVALNEMTTLEGSNRNIVERSGGYDANFMGLSRETADLACRRLAARSITCFMVGQE